MSQRYFFFGGEEEQMLHNQINHMAFCVFYKMFEWVFVSLQERMTAGADV